MDENKLDLLLDLQLRQTIALEKIASALTRLVPDIAPNYQFPLESFKTFDWSIIDAEVVKFDQYSAAIVRWNGKEFLRRSPSNKYGAAVWFSRCTGKNDDGSNQYEKLITFKPTSDRNVEPISEKARNYF